MLLCSFAGYGAMANSFKQDIGEYKGNLKLGDVKDNYDDLKQGHGPYVWKQISIDKELWFWFRPDRNEVYNEFEVVLITEVNKENSDDVQIIWPNKFSGRNFKLIYDLLYKELERKAD